MSHSGASEQTEDYGTTSMSWPGSLVLGRKGAGGKKKKTTTRMADNQLQRD